MSHLGTLNPGNWGIPVTEGDFKNIIQTVFTVAYSLAGVASVGYLIYGGYKIIMASGDPQKMKEGQQTVAYALIGLVVVISSAVIFNFVASSLGLEGVLGVLNLPTM
jgi:hypothetical protein